MKNEPNKAMQPSRIRLLVSIAFNNEPKMRARSDINPNVPKPIGIKRNSEYSFNFQVRRWA